MAIILLCRIRFFPLTVGSVFFLDNSDFNNVFFLRSWIRIRSFSEVGSGSGQSQQSDPDLFNFRSWILSISEVRSGSSQSQESDPDPVFLRSQSRIRSISEVGFVSGQSQMSNLDPVNHRSRIRIRSFSEVRSGHSQPESVLYNIQGLVLLIGTAYNLRHFRPSCPNIPMLACYSSLQFCPVWARHNFFKESEEKDG